MKLLTFDTSLNKTYIQLTKDGKSLGSRIVESKEDKYHSAYLISSIIELLRDNGMTMQSVDFLAVNIGPGSFTGIRACVTVAKIIAEQLDKKIIGINSLEILSRINDTSKKSLVILDARKSECFVASYSSSDEEIIAPQKITLDKLLKLDFEDYFVITDKSMYDFLSDKKIQTVCYEDTTCDLGEFLAKIAYEKLGTGDCIYNWYDLNPLYLQSHPAEAKKS